MAKLHRLRVCIGYNNDNSAILKRISANSELELADGVVRTILASERRNEFFAFPLSVTESQAPSFHDYASEWVTTYKIGKCKPSTIKGYNSILNEHLYPSFGKMPINRFDVKNIQMFLNNRKNASAKYLRDMKTLLGQILECAMRDGYLKDNPAKDPRIVIPSTKKFERTALTIDQLNSIIHALDYLQGDEQVYLALVVYTGMRRGEILGLRWEDIDIGCNMIHVMRNVTYTNNQPIIGTPKTASGERSIPIIPDLLKYLLPLKHEGYILDNDGKPKTLTMFKNMFKRIQEVTDLCGATSHSFRHTMGTLLNDVGADVKTIQGILGQKDYKTTMDRYVHPVETRKYEAISKISDLLNAGNK